MPVSYESASLLKCTVSMNYIRYIVMRRGSGEVSATEPAASPVKKIQSANNFREYYNNFGDNSQNSTNFGDFLDGSTGNNLIETVA